MAHRILWFFAILALPSSGCDSDRACPDRQYLGDAGLCQTPSDEDQTEDTEDDTDTAVGNSDSDPEEEPPDHGESIIADVDWEQVSD